MYLVIGICTGHAAFTIDLLEVTILLESLYICVLFLLQEIQTELKALVPTFLLLPPEGLRPTNDQANIRRIITGTESALTGTHL